MKFDSKAYDAMRRKVFGMGKKPFEIAADTVVGAAIPGSFAGSDTGKAISKSAFAVGARKAVKDMSDKAQSYLPLVKYLRKKKVR